MVESKASGLDMSETIEWYRSSGVRVPSFSDDKPLSYPIENRELIELSNMDLGGLFYLFPQNARSRSILRKIVGQPPTWFHKDSTSKEQIPTTNVDESLSPTAIVPSYIDYTPWRELKIPSADIWLYKIPVDAACEDVRRIILSEGFVHEVGHSIVQPALYVGDYILQLPNGKLVNGLEFMLHFAELAEQHPPISHYTTTYRGDKNKFESDDLEYKKVAISEELCETIAAYFLGFAYCGDGTRGRNPFEDRPEIREFVRDFLSATLIRDE